MLSRAAVSYRTGLVLIERGRARTLRSSGLEMWISWLNVGLDGFNFVTTIYTD